MTDRSFTDPERTRADESVMGGMLERLRLHAPSLPPDEVPSDRREYDDSGRRHWIAIPRAAALLRAQELTAVGFFGDPRSGVDHAEIDELEEMVVGRLVRYAAAGLLCYYDAEIAHGVNGNLVLFSGAGVPPEWHTDAVHARAVALAPRHYNRVRLHRAVLDGPFLGAGPLSVEQTRYFDFTEEPAWTGLRRFARGPDGILAATGEIVSQGGPSKASSNG